MLDLRLAEGETELESPASPFRAPIFVPQSRDYDEAGRYGQDNGVPRQMSLGTTDSGAREAKQMSTETRTATAPFDWGELAQKRMAIPPRRR